MAHLPTFAVPGVRQNTIQPPFAATIPAASPSLTVCNGNILLAGHIELARLEARTDSPDPAFHSETKKRSCFNDNSGLFESGEIGRTMLTRKHTYPMTMDAVGFAIIWRDSP
jgi:hypothetical protein